MDSLEGTGDASIRYERGEDRFSPPIAQQIAMTQTPPRVEQVPPALRLAAAERLVSVKGPARRRAARSLLESAPRVGIDPSLMWATTDPDRGRDWVGQVCLAVPGSGRTAMLFLSEPGHVRLQGSEATQIQERVLVLEAAFEGLGARPELEIEVAQSLPEPGQRWSIEACKRASMIHVGDLAYLRRPRPEHVGLQDPAALGWPEGVRVRRAGDLADPDNARAMVEALDRSYEDTLDCPELCGLRRTQDVLASHRSTGEFDPTHWWVAELDGRPEGCVLMSACPDQDALELVYLGLSTRLRGRGLGRLLLERAMSSAGRESLGTITCAVDRRNTPALALYERLGFHEFTSRVAYVQAIRA